MNKFKLRPVPNLQERIIPFDPNKQSLTQWLHSLTINPGYEACKRLLFGLRSLDQMELNLKLKFELFAQIIPVADDLVERIEPTYIDLGMPFTADEVAYVEIVVWIYSQLGGCFTNLRQHPEFETLPWTAQEKAKALYWVLYAASRVLLHTSQVYADVANGFWLNCYQNYNRAEREGLLNHAIKDIRKSEAVSVHQMFKQILLFACLDTECYRPRHLKKLYQLNQTLTDMVEITSADISQEQEEQQKGIFYLNLMSDQPPERVAKRINSGNSFERQLDVLKVANYLYRQLDPKNENKTHLQATERMLFLMLIKTLLNRAYKRKYTRLNLTTKSYGCIGFNNIIGLLAKDQATPTQPQSIVDKPKPVANKNNWPLPKFELLQEGDEDAYLFRQKQTIAAAVDPQTAKILEIGKQSAGVNKHWTQSSYQNPNTEQNLAIEHFEVCDSCLKGYGLNWTSATQRVKIGDIFGIEQNQGKRVEIGLICRITSLVDRSLRIGMELIGMESEIVSLEPLWNKRQSHQAIFIPEIKAFKQADSVVVGAGLFKTGQRVSMLRHNQKTNYRLSKLLNTTSAINHFELLLEVEEGLL